MEEKIDFVVAFVDMTDEKWMDGYKKFIEKYDMQMPDINDVEIRSRDYGTLRCLLSSVEKFMPWVNNVYLVVQSESQVPKWVNRENVKVVLHEEFIPKKYLPTYNTFTIQTHIHRIPGLSEKFIMSDDDNIITRYVTPEYFFIGDKIVQSVKKKNFELVKGSSCKDVHYYKAYASEVSKKNLNIKDDYYYLNDHSMQPFLKTLNEELYNKIDVDKHVSPLREIGNTFAFTYVVYSFLKRKVIMVPPYKNTSMEFRDKDYNQILVSLRKNILNDQFCINDQKIKDGIDKELFYKEVEKLITKLFYYGSKKYIKTCER